MSVSAIDTLMQLATPSRPVEPPARTAGATNGFAPALEKAYSGDKTRELAPIEEEDKLEAAVDDANRSDGQGPESSDQGSEVVETAAPAGETDEADDEAPADEVEISEMASTVVSGNEAKAAAAAVQADEAAVQPAVEVAGENGSDGDDTAKNASNSGENSEGSETKASTAYGKALGYVFGVGKLPADEPEGKAKAAKTGKTSNGEEGHGTPVAIDANKAEAEASTVAEVASTEAEKAAEKLTNEDAATDKPQAGEKSDSKTDKNDGVDRIKLPPIEQTPELAAAIERHVALMDQAATSAADAGGSQASGNMSAEAGASAPSPSKAQATLDRLAAASMRRGEGAAATDGGPAIDRHRFVQRVEGAMRAAQQRDGRIQVRLAPPELGSLRIELSVQNGVMAAKLEAETPTARNALLDNLPALRERLAEQNIRVEKFDVDVRRDSQGSGGNNAAFDGRDRGNDAGSHERRDRSPHLPQPKTSAAPARAAASTSDAGLDVRI